MVKHSFGKILSRKRRRDIRSNLSQFIVIFLMVFLGMFIFSGVRGYMDGMQNSADRYYEKNNLADIWLDGRPFSEQDLAKVKQIEGVKNAERVLRQRMNLVEKKGVTLELNFLETNEISKARVMEGSEYDFQDREGLWLDKYLADNLGYKVGDELTLEQQGDQIKFKIKGLILAPEYVYSIKDTSELVPTHMDFGFGFVSAKNLPAPFFSKILVDCDEEKVAKVKKELENKIEKVVATTRQDHLSYLRYDSEIEEGRVFSTIFTALFLLIAVLSVVSTMHRFIDNERVQIGVLKALGFSDRRIVRFYISYGFYLSIVAVIAGFILGRETVGKFFLAEEMKRFEMPDYQVVTTPIVFVLAILVVILITAVTYLSCRKILKEPATQALKKTPPKINKLRFNFTNKGIFKKASLNIKWNLRDISRNKARSLTAIAGAAGACILVVCAFGMKDSMLAYINWDFGLLNNFSHKLKLTDNISDLDLEVLKQKYGSQTTMNFGVEIMDRDENKKTSLTINDTEDAIRYTDHDLQLIELQDEGVYFTEKLARSLDKKIGDQIKWRKIGDQKWIEGKITGLVRNPENQIVNMTRTAAEKMGIDYKPNFLYLTKETSFDSTNQPGIEETQSLEAMKKSVSDMMEIIDAMVVLMATTSVILGAIVIYDLGSLSFTEKKYQFATMKVLGFKNRQIRKIFITQNIWLSLVSIAVGLPLGFMVTDILFKNGIGDTFDFEARITTATYVFTALGAILVSLLVNYLLSRKIKKIDMITSLKTAE